MGSALSSVAFIPNIFFYFTTTEYGAEPALLKPLLHTWSLGVEEQFYLIAPIFLLAVASRFTNLGLLRFLLTISLASFLLALYLTTIDPQLSFFLPFTRFWELLAGAIVAFLQVRYAFGSTLVKLSINQNFLINLATILGLALIFTSVITLNEATPHPGVARLIPIIGVCLVLYFANGIDIVSRILSVKPLRVLGLLSYSLYLWHYPIFAFARVNIADLTLTDKFILIIISFALSVISYLAIERPFRNKDLISVKMFAACSLSMVCIISSASAISILNGGFPQRFPPILSNQNLGAGNWYSYSQNAVVCLNRKENFCREIAGPEKPTIMAFGDSHLSILSESLISALGSDFNYLEANVSGCPLILNTYLIQNGNPSEICMAEFNARRMELTGNKQVTVILGGRFQEY